MEAELLQQLEEANAEADFYKLKCRNKKAELKEQGLREEELLAEIMRTKTNAEIYKREAELHDDNLLIWIHPGMPRKHALALAAVEKDPAIRRKSCIALKQGTQLLCADAAVKKRRAWCCAPETISVSAWSANHKLTGAPTAAP